MGKSENVPNSLQGKVALITGGGGGIGAASARLLARKGALLALLDQAEEGMHVIAGEISQATGQDPFLKVARVEQSAEVTRTVTEVVDRFGQIDILVNCAGTATYIPFLQLDEDAWDKELDINLKGTFLCCRAVGPTMTKQRQGAIVNISSGLAVKGGINLAHYSASKAGILALTKSVALELAPYGVRVNAIAPGAVDTALFRGHYTTESQVKMMAAAIPLGRIGQPDDMAHAVCFLVSPESAYITGQTLHVNGGLTMP